jgi:cyclopropane-fatty-acyl-phospholipid synthase
MSLFDRFLSRIVKRGTLTVTDHHGTTKTYGSATEGFPDIAIRLADGRVALDIGRRPELGSGEAYMDQRLQIEGDDILGLLKLIHSNNAWEDGDTIDDHGALRRLAWKVQSRIDRINWARRAKRNVAHHYDLDDRLFALFLDDERQYSCAYFTDPGNSLEQAQADKQAHIIAKLALEPGMRVLDIGCGWGGLARTMHAKAGVDVVGITLSEEQLKVARDKAAAAGVADHVTFALQDYRAMTGHFDRIVSVGMFEHVGPPFYDAFFAKCRDLLAPDGVMLLHTIGRLDGPGKTDAWTAKYIFPGGYIPALSEIVSASEPHKLIPTDIECLRLHYALTLRHWYKRAMANRAAIEALYDERFFRMWQFYLAGAAIAFEHNGLCNYQIQYSRSRYTLPITRDYIGVAEAALNG